MASKIIGRAPCPLGDNDAAHVKQSDKCVYLYCPECGTQLHARTEKQRGLLLAKTRLVEPAPTPTGPTPTGRDGAAPAPAAPTPSDPGTATPPAAPPKPAAPVKRGLFF